MHGPPNIIMQIPRPDVFYWATIKQLLKHIHVPLTMPQAYLYHILRFVSYHKVCLITRDKRLRSIIMVEQIDHIFNMIAETRSIKKYPCNGKRGTGQKTLIKIRLMYNSYKNRLSRETQKNMDTMLTYKFSRALYWTLMHFWPRHQEDSGDVCMKDTNDAYNMSMSYEYL